MPFLPVTELKVTIGAKFTYKNRNIFIYILLSQKKRKKKKMHE